MNKKITMLILSFYLSLIITAGFAQSSLELGKVLNDAGEEKNLIVLTTTISDIMKQALGTQYSFAYLLRFNIENKGTSDINGLIVLDARLKGSNYKMFCAHPLETQAHGGKCALTFPSTNRIFRPGKNIIDVYIKPEYVGGDNVMNGTYEVDIGIWKPLSNEQIENAANDYKNQKLYDKGIVFESVFDCIGVRDSTGSSRTERDVLLASDKYCGANLDNYVYFQKTNIGEFPLTGAYSPSIGTVYGTVDYFIGLKYAGYNIRSSKGVNFDRATFDIFDKDGVFVDSLEDVIQGESRDSTVTGLNIKLISVRALKTGLVLSADIRVGPINSLEHIYDGVADVSSVGASSDRFPGENFWGIQVKGFSDKKINAGDEIQVVFDPLADIVISDYTPSGSAKSEYILYSLPNNYGHIGFYFDANERVNKITYVPYKYDLKKEKINWMGKEYFYHETIVITDNNGNEYRLTDPSDNARTEVNIDPVDKLTIKSKGIIYKLVFDDSLNLGSANGKGSISNPEYKNPVAIELLGKKIYIVGIGSNLIKVL